MKEVFLKMSSVLQQLPTEDNMCTRPISQHLKQERRGSFFKVSASNQALSKTRSGLYPPVGGHLQASTGHY